MPIRHDANLLHAIPIPSRNPLNTNFIRSTSSSFRKPTFAFTIISVPYTWSRAITSPPNPTFLPQTPIPTIPISHPLSILSRRITIPPIPPPISPSAPKIGTPITKQLSLRPMRYTSYKSPSLPTRPQSCSFCTLGVITHLCLGGYHVAEPLEGVETAVDEEDY